MAVPFLIFGVLAMNEGPTTVIIQRYLDALPGDTAAEPIIRELLEREVGRMRLLCGTLLHKSYPRLTRPPTRRGEFASKRFLLRSFRPARASRSTQRAEVRHAEGNSALGVAPFGRFDRGFFRLAVMLSH
jgi:hypothetical protein